MSDTPDTVETVDQKMGQAVGTLKNAVAAFQRHYGPPEFESVTVRAEGIDVPVLVKALTPEGAPWYEAVVINYRCEDADDAASVGHRVIGRALKREAQKRKAAR